MEDVLARIAHNLIDRVSGPMHFRLYVQPMMAVIYAVLSGVKDAKAGNTPYFWALVTDPAQRGALIRDGLKSIGKLLVLAVVLDVVYQIIVLRFVYPGEAILVALILAILPYLIVRGLVNRIVRYTLRSAGRGGSKPSPTSSRR